jgi:hypothetical protein
VAGVAILGGDQLGTAFTTRIAVATIALAPEVISRSCRISVVCPENIVVETKVRLVWKRTDGQLGEVRRPDSCLELLPQC